MNSARKEVENNAEKAKFSLEDLVDELPNV